MKPSVSESSAKAVASQVHGRHSLQVANLTSTNLHTKAQVTIMYFFASGLHIGRDSEKTLQNLPLHSVPATLLQT